MFNINHHGCPKFGKYGILGQGITFVSGKSTKKLEKSGDFTTKATIFIYI